MEYSEVCLATAGTPASQDSTERTDRMNRQIIPGVAGYNIQRTRGASPNLRGTGMNDNSHYCDL